MSLEGPCSRAALDVTAELCGGVWPPPRSLSRVVLCPGLWRPHRPVLSRWWRQRALNRFGRAQRAEMGRRSRKSPLPGRGSHVGRWRRKPASRQARPSGKNDGGHLCPRKRQEQVPLNVLSHPRGQLVTRTQVKLGGARLSGSHTPAPLGVITPRGQGTHFSPLEYQKHAPHIVGLQYVNVHLMGNNSWVFPPWLEGLETTKTFTTMKTQQHPMMTKGMEGGPKTL